MASEDVQTNLRLPADLKERLVASAAESNRSLSAEVASRLEASYQRTDGFVTKEDFDDTMRRIAGSYEADQAVMASVRTMLANNVVRLYEHLPESLRTEAFENIYEFAKTLKSPGAPGMEDIIARMMGADSVGDVHKQLAAALRRQEIQFQRRIDQLKD